MTHREKVTGRTLRPIRVLWTFALAGCAAPAASPAQAPQAFAGIDTTIIRDITRDLAHDSLAGRGTGTAGAAAAALMIEQACRDYGLHPVSNRYRHPVPLTLTDVRAGTRLAIRGGPGPESAFTFDADSDFVFQAAPPAVIRDFSGPAIYVGTEVSLREGEPLPPSLDGAVAVTLGPVSPEMARRLATTGAAGIVHLVPDLDQFSQLRRNATRGLWALDDGGVQTSHLYPIPSVVLGRDASTVLAEAAQPDGPTWPRFDRTIDVRVTTSQAPVTDYNVACALPGAGAAARDTALVYTAHYDHLGIWPGGPSTDSIYNGFSDNAAGVGMLLAIARAMRASPRPPRYTVLFLFFAAEEVGLLGSEHFVQAPPWPLSRMKAVINLDAGAPPAKPWSWRIAGGDSSAMGYLAMDVAARRGWSAITSAATANSDYYPFWQHGVPAIFIIPGPATYEGISADSSDALRERWDRYHQAGDEWNDDFPFEGLGRYAEYALEVGIAVMTRDGS